MIRFYPVYFKKTSLTEAAQHLLEIYSMLLLIFFFFLMHLHFISIVVQHYLFEFVGVDFQVISLISRYGISLYWHGFKLHLLFCMEAVILIYKGILCFRKTKCSWDCRKIVLFFLTCPSSCVIPYLPLYSFYNEGPDREEKCLPKLIGVAAGALILLVLVAVITHWTTKRSIKKKLLISSSQTSNDSSDSCEVRWSICQWVLSFLYLYLT